MAFATQMHAYQYILYTQKKKKKWYQNEFFYRSSGGKMQVVSFGANRRVLVQKGLDPQRNRFFFFLGKKKDVVVLVKVSQF